MSFITVFKIGIWNAWILRATWLTVNAFFNWLMFRCDLEWFNKKVLTNSYYMKHEKKIRVLSPVSLFFLSICFVFLSLKLGITWFYTGLALLLIGSVITKAITIYCITTNYQPITGGLYHYSQDPENIAYSSQPFM